VQSAGVTGGTPGSPALPGASPESTMWISPTPMPESMTQTTRSARTAPSSAADASITWGA
jgi:hypothetical protein